MNNLAGKTTEVQPNVVDDVAQSFRALAERLPERPSNHELFRVDRQCAIWIGRLQDYLREAADDAAVEDSSDVDALIAEISTARVHWRSLCELRVRRAPADRNHAIDVRAPDDANDQREVGGERWATGSGTS